MAKALKPLIVILLVVSVVSLVLGILLFQKRGLLKGRTQKLESRIQEAVGKLSAARDPFIQAKQPARLDDNRIKQVDQMDVELAQMLALVQNRYEELDQTYNDLKKARDELDLTKQELAKAQQELADARKQLAQAQQDVAAARSELAQAKTQVAQLEEERTGLQTQIDDLTQKLSEAQDTIREKDDEITQVNNELDAFRAKYEPKNAGVMPEGLSGHVLVVNPDWNFVVLDIGSATNASPGGEMLVHRGDALVGKVRISAVDERLSIAEILREWQKSPIREGDDVLH